MTNARKGALILASSLVLAIVSEVRAHGEPVIVVEPAVVAAGGEVTVTGSEMEPGETFTIVLDGTAASVSLGEATAAGEGEEAGFVVEYAIPADLPPGSYILRATTEEGETFAHRLEFTVTDLTKEIQGVQTRVAWIVDYRNDEVVEKEIAFYAQDNGGNVWYLGEYPEEYEDGEFVAAPTWIHGLQDAKAGIKMKAAPQPGTPSYFQGWAPAVDWADYAQVDNMGQETCVPLDCYADVLVIAESSLAEKDAFQLKYYARDVGEIRVDWRGADATQEALELVDFMLLSPEALAQVRALALELEKHAYEISKEVYALTPPAE